MVERRVADMSSLCFLLITPLLQRTDSVKSAENLALRIGAKITKHILNALSAAQRQKEKMLKAWDQVFVALIG
jgi:hypothetical protein